jgi:hypothetical protein
MGADAFQRPRPAQGLGAQVAGAEQKFRDMPDGNGNGFRHGAPDASMVAGGCLYHGAMGATTRRRPASLHVFCIDSMKMVQKF